MGGRRPYHGHLLYVQDSEKMNARSPALIFNTVGSSRAAVPRITTILPMCPCNAMRKKQPLRLYLLLPSLSPEASLLYIDQIRKKHGTLIAPKSICAGIALIACKSICAGFTWCCGLREMPHTQNLNLILSIKHSSSPSLRCLCFPLLSPLLAKPFHLFFQTWH